mmetsp:Transcript_44185/g.50986  ORF Transcript_44185/g.50986 Transcript_44185/m.50986 type:complete len:185 (+) Transcript_44185:107-661(+)
MSGGCPSKEETTSKQASKQSTTSQHRSVSVSIPFGSRSRIGVVRFDTHDTRGSNYVPCRVCRSKSNNSNNNTSTLQWLRWRWHREGVYRIGYEEERERAMMRFDSIRSSRYRVPSRTEQDMDADRRLPITSHHITSHHITHRELNGTERNSTYVCLCVSVLCCVVLCSFCYANIVHPPFFRRDN